MDAAGLAEAISAGDVEVIDVRRDYEFEAGHIPGARHLDLNDLAANADSLPKDRPVVFYCRSGNRSAAALQLMLGESFTSVYHLDGGIGAWTATGRPTVT